MSFLYAFALAAIVLVVAPYVAHRLRRHHTEARPFAPVHLVVPLPVRARKPSSVEDRALLATRALCIVALAVLGAWPFVHCSRLSIRRNGGASIAMAIVLDDSMSMRARSGSRSRFTRAREGALQLLASARDGDSVALVLAGSPARVALAPTTDLRAAATALEEASESDRATDLDGAVAMATSLFEGLPQTDRRVVLLSDLADGQPDAPPLAEGRAVPVWNPLPEIASDARDCAILRADREGSRVRVRVACSPGSRSTASPPTPVAVYCNRQRVAMQLVPPGVAGEATMSLPGDAAGCGQQPGALMARLEARDAIASDDAAPVVNEARSGALAVIVPVDTETAVTGGAPVVEQALQALRLDAAVRPLPQIPDRPEDLTAFEGLLLDDPAGLTPEERRAVGAFVEGGGFLLLALGPRAANPPLGATLEPFLNQPIAWEVTRAPGADTASALDPFAESAGSLRELSARHRAVLRPEDARSFMSLLAWTDRAPLVARRAMGRGEVWIATLPFALDASDLPLRPAFLSLLEGWATAAQSRAIPRRTEVGSTWQFLDAHKVTVTDPDGEPVRVARDGAAFRATPSRLGMHRVEIDGRVDWRVVEPVTREVDLRPRRMGKATAIDAAGDAPGAVDASRAIALGLLALVALEIVLRLRAARDRRHA